VEFLDLLSIGAIIFSVSVIINKNPISSLMSLIGLFGVIAVYLIQTGLEYIGFSYLIVYIGAVSILFLFILMLINIRTSELQFSTSNSTPLALFLVLLLNYILFQILPYYVTVINNNNNKLNNIVYSFHETSTEAFDFISKLGFGIRNVMFVTSNN
jgi:NADH-ubiquinone oxidoreductase chain 6